MEDGPKITQPGDVRKLNGMHMHVDSTLLRVLLEKLGEEFAIGLRMFYVGPNLRVSEWSALTSQHNVIGYAAFSS